LFIFLRKVFKFLFLSESIARGNISFPSFFSAHERFVGQRSNFIQTSEITLELIQYPFSYNGGLLETLLMYGCGPYETEKDGKKVVRGG